MRPSNVVPLDRKTAPAEAVAAPSKPPAEVVDLASVRAARAPTEPALAWRVTAANDRGVEDGQVHLRGSRGGETLCRDTLSPPEAYQFGLCLLAAAAVASRRQRGTVELRLLRPDGTPVHPERLVEGVALQRNADAVLIRVGRGAAEWFVLSTGLPLRRDRRTHYWHLSAHDARHLRRALPA